MQGSKFDRLVASAYRVEEKTVRHFTRLLKEAGLLTTGARGVNAPHMVPRDAARTTIALLATDKPSRAVEMVGRFSGLPYRSDRSRGPHPERMGIADGKVFEEVLTNIFSELGSDADEAPYVEIQENARTATIEHRNGKALFADAVRSEELRKSDTKDLFGIRRARGVASAEISILQAAFYVERAPDDESAPLLAHVLEIVTGGAEAKS